MKVPNRRTFTPTPVMANANLARARAAGAQRRRQTCRGTTYRGGGYRTRNIFPGEMACIHSLTELDYGAVRGIVEGRFQLALPTDRVAA